MQVLAQASVLSASSNQRIERNATLAELGGAQI